MKEHTSREKKNSWQNLTKKTRNYMATHYHEKMVCRPNCIILSRNQTHPTRLPIISKGKYNGTELQNVITEKKREYDT